MPSFSQYKKILGSPKTIGEQHKIESDMITEVTWDNDIATRDCYFYDFWHDSYKAQLNKLDPVNDPNKIKMRVKFYASAKETFAKDPVTHRIQLKPSQDNVIPYYDEFFKNRYNAEYPVGLFVDIQDSKGQYNKWLVIGKADDDNQFSTFEVLRCNYVVQYVFEGVKHEVACVLRSQNSYNSGVWVDYKIEVTQDQQKFITSLNRETEKLYYNQRIIIDNKILTEPRTWTISKINRIDNNGTVLITLAQSKFNPTKDYIEIGEDGEVIGMWADYFDSPVEPISQDKEEIQLKHSTITFSGLKSELKVLGSYKKFTVNFYNEDGTESELESGKWTYTIDDKDASSLIYVSKISDNQVKIKFTGDDTYIGSILNVSYISDSGIKSVLPVAITGL